MEIGGHSLKNSHLMQNRLKRETARLKKSWMQYNETMLRDYLVEQVEDPRINMQSILTRHFLIEGLFGSRFAALKEEELRFGAVMNWLLKLSEHGLCREEARSILYALSKGADNAGGIEIPHFVASIFAGLPKKADGLTVPNYIRAALEGVPLETDKLVLIEQAKATFQVLWRK